MRCGFFVPFCSLFLALASLGGVCQAEQVVLLQFEKKGALLPPVAIGLYDSDTPRHAANFRELVGRGFYKKTGVHRVVSGKLLQMGDPLSRMKDSPDLGTGGPGYTLPPEIGRRHERGSVAMGRLPDKINPSRLSNGSQFYVALEALPNLDGTDTVFGRVERGMEVLEGISRGAIDTNESPVERVLIRRARVVSRERLDQEMASWDASAKRTPSWLERNFSRLWPF
jgi:cyclophilin family peptidyl-prolyl cis-trans isomerase